LFLIYKIIANQLLMEIPNAGRRVILSTSANHPLCDLDRPTDSVILVHMIQLSSLSCALDSEESFQ